MNSSLTATLMKKLVRKILPTVKNGAIVFTRMEDDSKRDIIVLDEEDHLRRSRKKRTFVVLRRTSSANKYYVFIAYLRKNTLAKKGSTDHIEYEWDHWDARGSSKNKMVGFVWANCEKTSYISCRSQISVKDWSASQSKDSNEIPEYSSEQSKEVTGRALTSAQDPDFEIVTKETKQDKMFESAKYDYFLDLLNCPLKAKIVGHTVQLLTEASVTLAIAQKVQPDIFGSPPPGENGTVALSPEAKTAAANALAARLERFAGGLTVMGTLVQGMNSNGRTAIVNPKSAVVGKLFFFAFFIIRKGNSNQALIGTAKKNETETPEANPNPAKLFEPTVLSNIANLTEQLGSGDTKIGQPNGRIIAGRGLLSGLGQVLNKLLGGVGDLLAGKDSEEEAAAAEKKKKEEQLMLSSLLVLLNEHSKKNKKQQPKEGDGVGDGDVDLSEEPIDVDKKGNEAEEEDDKVEQKARVLRKSKIVVMPEGDRYLKTSNGLHFHVHKDGAIGKISEGRFLRVMMLQGVKLNFDPQKELAKSRESKQRKKRSVGGRGGKHHKRHHKKRSHKGHKKDKIAHEKPASQIEPAARVVSSSDLKPVSGNELTLVATKMMNEISISALGNKKHGRSNLAAVPGAQDVAIAQGLDTLMKPEKTKKPSYVVYSGQGGRAAFQLPTKNEIANAFETDADLFSKVGWQTQDACIGTLDKSLESAEEEPFTGLGACPHNKLNLQEAKTPEEVVKFYLNVLRTGCCSVLTNSVLTLIDEECLQLKTAHNNLTLALSSTCPLMTKAKLTSSERIKLSLAFEVAVFSQIFYEEAEEVDRTNHKPHSLSRSVRTLKKIALLTFEKAGKLVPQHYIKLTRNLVLTLKSAFVKSLQDLVRVKDCQVCTPAQKEQVRNDATVVSALIQFITTELEPEEGGQAAFEAFYKKSHKYLQDKLADYV